MSNYKNNLYQNNHIGGGTFYGPKGRGNQQNPLNLCPTCKKPTKGNEYDSRCYACFKLDPPPESEPAKLYFNGHFLGVIDGPIKITPSEPVNEAYQAQEILLELSEDNNE